MEITERARGQAFTRPELAVLLAYAKLALYAELLDSAVPTIHIWAANWGAISRKN
jgi:glutamate dehydrogenase